MVRVHVGPQKTLQNRRVFFISFKIGVFLNLTDL